MAVTAETLRKFSQAYRSVLEQFHNRPLDDANKAMLLRDVNTGRTFIAAGPPPGVGGAWSSFLFWHGKAVEKLNEAPQAQWKIGTIVPGALEQARAARAAAAAAALVNGAPPPTGTATPAPPPAWAAPPENGMVNGGNGGNGGNGMTESFWDTYKNWIIGGVAVVVVGGAIYYLFGRED